MGAVTTLPHGRALTVADLEAFPEDETHRYELIDGILIVSPSPRVRHQIISASLLVQLTVACPADLRVLTAPTDVVLAEDTLLVPDLVVAPKADFSEKNLPTAPLLAVEILSPNTRLIDLNVKHDRYRRAGVRSYWVVEPEEPRLTAWELRNGDYVRVADVGGDQAFVTDRPFAITIRPSDLID